MDPDPNKALDPNTDPFIMMLKHSEIHISQTSVAGPGCLSRFPAPGSASKNLSMLTHKKVKNTGYHIVIDFNPFRECTTTLRDCVPLLMNYDVLRSQFEWLINGDTIVTHVQDNLGTQLTVLEKFLR
jgi:hypothetical protein